MDDGARNASNLPEGMITVEEFAQQKGMEPAKAIAMIKDGFCAGRVIDGQWYVDLSEASQWKSGPSAAGMNKELFTSNYLTARWISTLTTYLGGVVFTLGIVIAASMIPEYAYSMKSYVVALTPGMALSGLGVFFAAAGLTTRAAVDNADHTREILKALKHKS